MISPIHGVNIFDIICYWLTRNSGYDPTKINDLRMFVKLVSLPESFIKNPKAKAKPFKRGRPPSTVKGGRGVSKVKHKLAWDPY